MSASSRVRILAAGTLTVVLAACGSGTATQVPPTSTATPAATQAPTQAATQVPAASPTEAAVEPTPDPLALAAPFEGTYSGTWINETFGSTGPVSVAVSLDRATGSIVLELTLGGNVFGNPSPEPETLTATLGPGQALAFTSKTFGETTVTVDLAGGAPVLTFSSPDVPSDRIKTFTATTTIGDPAALDFEYEVTFRDGVPAAQGRATLSR